MLDFTIAKDVGIIGFSINSYQNWVADKLKPDFLGAAEKYRKKALGTCAEPFGKEN